jgi:hypothetical protein
MAVDKQITLTIIRSELEKCRSDADKYGWEISELDEESVSFRVNMVSPIDNEVFIVSFKCDNYKEWPPLIDFIDPISKQAGVKNAYPLNPDSFFNTDKVSICHPCSRNAYQNYKGFHPEWILSGWESNPKTGALKNIRGILLAIQERISQAEYYKGRMK